MILALLDGIYRSISGLIFPSPAVVYVSLSLLSSSAFAVSSYSAFPASTMSSHAVKGCRLAAVESLPLNPRVEEVDQEALLTLTSIL